MLSLEEIATSLGKAKKTAGGYLCKCPCHEDKEASLSITMGDRNEVIVNCFANCDWLTVKKELEARGLLKKNSSYRPHTGKDSNFVADLQNKKRSSNNFPDGTRIYQYRDQAGNILCRKVKLPSKKMWFERLEGDAWYSGLDGMLVPLYNIQRVMAASLVFLVEGEKDAETINNGGECGTTNHAGAKGWPPHLTEQLRDKRVIICLDNDEAGRKRLKTLTKALAPVVKELRVFNPQGVDVKGDVTDWVEAGGKVSDILGLSTPVSIKPAAKKATRDDYTAAIEAYFGELRRDIFSEDLVYRDKWSNRWQPAINSLPSLRSEIRELAVNSEKQYRASEVEDHLLYLEAHATPQFVIDIPEWDGRDRILELAQRVVLSDKQGAIGVNESVFCDLLKNWHSKMWQRLEDPTVRNEIFILAGEQNIGKDFWIRENCDGLEQYLINFSIHSNERDTKEQLHRGLVMNISEFDRTSRSEVSLLKEIVTATQTDIRFAYDRRSKSRPCRCSFIASTNVKDIFNDPTGHSRYVFFELKLIDKSTRFTETDKLQVLAQGRALAEAGFVAQESSLAVMRSQIVELTPDDEYELLVDRWDYLATERYRELAHFDKDRFKTKDEDGEFSGFLPNDCTFEIMIQLSKEFDKSSKKIRSTLKLKGRQRVHHRFGRGFYFKNTTLSESKQEFPI